jgi:hypothetical protein
VEVATGQGACWSRSSLNEPEDKGGFVYVKKPDEKRFRVTRN